MSRRVVSVCILALAGMASFSAARAGIHDSRASSSPSQAMKYGQRSLRIGDIGANAQARPQMAAPAGAECVQRRNCLSPLAIPMTFEPNVGQFARQVKFVGRGGGLTLFLTGGGIDVAVPNVGHGAPRSGAVRIRFDWAGADHRRTAAGPSFAWRGGGQVKTISNYFLSRNPRAWRTNVAHFARVIGYSRSPRLETTIYGTNSGVEYDLRLAPREDARKLRIRLVGAGSVNLSAGNLFLDVGGRELRMGKPRIYEELRGVRKILRGEYLIESDGSVGLRIAGRDPHATLVLDPSLSFAYATFLGGAGNETAGNMAIDASGKVYVSGVTTSATTFPEPTAASMGSVLSSSAFYVAKIDPTVSGPNSLLYLTFLGGSGIQTGGLIALDAAGDVALTGTTTSIDFPVTGSSEPTEGLTSGSGNDAVVSEINAAGNQLNFSAYFGGSGTLSLEGAGGIAVDSTGNVYIASDVQPSQADPSSPDLPVAATGGSMQPYQAVWDGMGSDGFLAVFAPPAQAGGAPVLTYCTYLGTISAAPVAIGGVAVDSGGDAYIAGSTSNAGNTFPAQNAFQSSYGGGSSDGFVMQIAPQGQGASDLLYATLLGGSGADQILAIALDPPNTLPAGIPPSAYVVGETQSGTDFPTRNAYQSALKCAQPEQACPSTNAFLAVIAQDAVSHQTSLVYSTYLGGSDTDAAQAVAVTASSSVYIAGRTNSADFPWHDNVQPFNTGDSPTDSDAFLAKFDTTSSGTASLLYSTPLGGTAAPGASASSAATAVALGGAGQVYVTGQTSAADFPTALTSSGAQANGFQQQCSSCQLATPASDVFLLSFSESNGPVASVYFSSGAVAAGAYSLGSAGVPQSVAILNGGDQGKDLEISSMDFIGPNAADFSAEVGPGCLDVPIAPAVPGSSPTCSLEIGFTPSIGGPEQAFLAITDNAPGSPQLLELKGTGAAPHAQVLPASVNFGSQPIDATAWRTVTLTNTGTEPLGFRFGSPAAPYQIGSIACPATQNSATTLQSGNTCTVQIGFAPSATGEFQGQFTITDNSDSQSNAQQVVTLSGTAVTAAPLVQVSPMTLAFGATVAGAASNPQSVILQNQGSGPLDVSAISISGTNAADFRILGTGTTCTLTGTTVAASGECAVAVQFAPQSVGSSKTAELTFADNAATSPQTVTLAGVATSAPSFTASPSTLAFGPQSEGTASVAQVVTITNTGSGAAGIPAISISGSADFVQSNSCPPVIGAGAKCQVYITFQPVETAAAGAASAALLIPGATPSSVSLSGTATQPAISLTTSLSFASQLVGTTGAPQPVTITNSSSGAAAGVLAFTGISIGGANRGDFGIAANQCSGSAGVAPGNSCTVQIVFQPQASSTCGSDPNRTASLEIADNAPGSPQSVPLSGPAADYCLATGNGQPVSTPIQPGQTATFSMEVASAGGFTGTVSLSCAIAPAGADLGPCAIGTTPASNPPSVQVTPTAAAQFTVSVPTVAPSTGTAFGRAPRWRTPLCPLAQLSALAAGCAWLAGMLWLAAGAARRRGGGFAPRRLRAIRCARIAALATGFALCIAGCGSTGDPPAASISGTPAGTYTVTVTASTTSGNSSTSRTASLTITVEPPSS